VARVSANSRRGLVAAWTEKQVESLIDDNMLRGSWAEHLVAHFLEISERVPQWSYFDLQDRSGTRISVKQSVSIAPRFAVARTAHAWSPSRGAEGEWLPVGDGYGYWCDLYVFAWLNRAQSEVTLDEIIDPGTWLFAALSRGEMAELFPGSIEDGVVSGQRTAGLSALGRERFRSGRELRSAVDALGGSY
jgi:hypothetical protein